MAFNSFHIGIPSPNGFSRLTSRISKLIFNHLQREKRAFSEGDPRFLEALKPLGNSRPASAGKGLSREKPNRKKTRVALEVMKEVYGFVGIIACAEVAAFWAIGQRGEWVIIDTISQMSSATAIRQTPANLTQDSCSVDSFQPAARQAIPMIRQTTIKIGASWTKSQTPIRKAKKTPTAHFPQSSFARMRISKSIWKLLKKLRIKLIKSAICHLKLVFKRK